MVTPVTGSFIMGRGLPVIKGAPVIEGLPVIGRGISVLEGALGHKGGGSPSSPSHFKLLLIPSPNT